MKCCINLYRNIFGCINGIQGENQIKKRFSDLPTLSRLRHVSGNTAIFILPLVSISKTFRFTSYAVCTCIIFFKPHRIVLSFNNKCPFPYQYAHMYPSLIARRWVGRQTYDGPDLKLFKDIQMNHQLSALCKTILRPKRNHSTNENRAFELIFKFNVGLKTLLREGMSEQEFYGDLVYKFKKLIGRSDFSFQIRKIITRYRRICYNLSVMRQSACLVFNQIMVDNYAAFFNCTPVGQASDSIMAPTYSYLF